MPEPGKGQPAHLQLLAISWNFGWPVAAGVVAGHWLDVHFGCSPALTLLFGIGAMAAAVRRLLVLGNQERAERDQAARDEADEDARQ